MNFSIEFSTRNDLYINVDARMERLTVPRTSLCFILFLPYNLIKTINLNWIRLSLSLSLSSHRCRYLPPSSFSYTFPLCPSFKASFFFLPLCPFLLFPSILPPPSSSFYFDPWLTPISPSPYLPPSPLLLQRLNSPFQLHSLPFSITPIGSPNFSFTPFLPPPFLLSHPSFSFLLPPCPPPTLCTTLHYSIKAIKMGTY